MPKVFAFSKNFFKAFFKMRKYISWSLRNHLCRIKTRKNISFLLKNMNYYQSYGAMPSANELKTVVGACPILILSLKWQSWKHFQLKSLSAGWSPMSHFTCELIYPSVCGLRSPAGLLLVGKDPNLNVAFPHPWQNAFLIAVSTWI